MFLYIFNLQPSVSCVFLSAVNLLYSIFKNVFVCLFHFAFYENSHFTNSANDDFAYDDSKDSSNQKDTMDSSNNNHNNIKSMII